MKLNFFNFKRVGDKVLMTNDFGSHLFVSPDEFQQVVRGKVEADSDLGRRLIDRNMAYTETSLEYSASRMHDLRMIKNHASVATTLHIFVVATACNVACVYCQADGEVGRPTKLMTREIAEKAVDVALQSPSHFLTFEFQGGEPLLNFDVIKHIVEYAEEHKGNHEIDYSIVTNMTLMTEDKMDYLVEHGFGISTSLDGPEYVHDANRPFRSGGGTFQKALEGIAMARKRGVRVGAIQTTTRAALPYAREVVRTYADLGFDSIFIRPLTPLGKAAHRWDEIGYTADEFAVFYAEAVDELIEINKTGRYLREDHAGIFLGRIFGKAMNYMELRSPCGAGLGQLAYHVDGDVFTCDEGRMLHEMGDHSFRLGNVFENSYVDMVSCGACRAVCASSVLESIPSCCDCVYQPYCGVCPVVNYAESSDIIEKEPHGYRCKLYASMLDYLFGKFLEGDEAVANVLKSWGN